MLAALSKPRAFCLARRVSTTTQAITTQMPAPYTQSADLANGVKIPKLGLGTWYVP